ncbi:transmembrane protein 156 [Cricetulus griseus]
MLLMGPFLFSPFFLCILPTRRSAVSVGFTSLVWTPLLFTRPSLQLDSSSVQCLAVGFCFYFHQLLDEGWRIKRTQELACREVCLLPNLTNLLPSFNFSSVAFLQPAEETQTVMGLFPNHSSFQSFSKICQGITSGFPMCSLCLVCESKGDVDLISQEQTPKGLITRGSMEVKANDFYSPCQHFNVTVALLVDPMKEYNTTCTPEYHPGKSTTVEEEPSRENSLNHTCGIVGNMSNCTHVFLHLAMDVKCKFEMK